MKGYWVRIKTWYREQRGAITALICITVTILVLKGVAAYIITTKVIHPFIITVMG